MGKTHGKSLQDGPAMLSLSKTLCVEHPNPLSHIFDSALSVNLTVASHLHMFTLGHLVTPPAHPSLGQKVASFSMGHRAQVSSGRSSKHNTHNFEFRTDNTFTNT